MGEPSNQHEYGDFKTMVQELTWLDQRDTVPVSVPPTLLPPFEPLRVNVSPGLPSPFELSHMYPPEFTPDPSAMANYFKLREKLAENTAKYRALLRATEFFCAGEWTKGDIDIICDGVYQPDTRCRRALAAADFAISSLASEKRRREQLRLKRLIRANARLLGRYGWVYWLTIEASNDKFYEAVVVVSSNQSERVLKFIRPAKYFPEIPAHLLHLWGPNY